MITLPSDFVRDN